MRAARKAHNAALGVTGGKGNGAAVEGEDG
jgi:hypothetical protein